MQNVGQRPYRLLKIVFEPEFPVPVDTKRNIVVLLVNGSFKRFSRYLHFGKIESEGRVNLNLVLRAFLFVKDF